jgi:protein disulfide-isomerase
MVYPFAKEVLFYTGVCKWAAANVILVELDYPRNCAVSEIKTKQRLQQVSVSRFPTFTLQTELIKKAVNFEGLGKTGYVAGGPVAWFAVANENS